MIRAILRVPYLNRKSLLPHLCLLVCFFGLAASAFAQPPGGANGWSLVFSDEFNGTTLDQSKWSYNYPWGPTHNHRAYSAPENVKVEDGKLKIIAENRRHPNAPAGVTHNGTWLPLDYTGGAINSKNKFNFTYGYAEARLKLPGSRGFWPAFWTLNASGEWPPEIDIMEYLSSESTKLHTNYHWGPSWNNTSSHYQTFTNNPNLSLDYHVYAVEWTPSSMKWFLDGKQIGTTLTNATAIAQSKNMFLLLNLAVGGWEKDPDATTQWPGVYECDWVRVWQKTPVLQPGIYKITARHSGKALQVANASSENGALVQQWEYTGAANQKWRAEIVDGGLYRFTNLHSNKVLDIQQSSTENNAVVHQWSWANGSNQKWILEDAGGGFTKVLAQHSGKGIDVLQSSMADGAAVLQWSYWGGPNQQWKFEEVVGVTSAATELPGAEASFLEVYPNPAGKNAFVSFQVQQSGSTVVALFNLKGQLLQTLFSGNLKQQESQSVHLNSAGLNPGVYVIRLTGAGETRNLKLVVR